MIYSQLTKEMCLSHLGLTASPPLSGPIGDPSGALQQPGWGRLHPEPRPMVGAIVAPIHLLSLTCAVSLWGLSLEGRNSFGKLGFHHHSSVCLLLYFLTDQVWLFLVLPGHGKK